MDVAMGSAERVGDLCARLERGLREAPPSESLNAGILSLARRLRERGGAIALPVFALVTRLAGSQPATSSAAATGDVATGTAASVNCAWPLLRELLMAREPDFVRRALGLALERARAGSLLVDGAVLECLADRVEAEGSPLREPDGLETIRQLLACQTGGGAASTDARVLAIYLESKSPSLRRLAARILDLAGEPVAPVIAARVLGDEAQRFLAPYLAYTRAGHADLLHLAAGGPPASGSAAGVPAPLLASLRRAEAVCGEALLRAIVAELGWARLSRGLDAVRFIGLSLAGSIPFMVPLEEAPLLETLAEVRRTGEAIVVVAQGGLPLASHEATDSAGGVARFRALNLAHAALLTDILDVAPLDRDKVLRVLDRMDHVVDDFVALFAARSEECAILPALYRDLKGRILAELAKESVAPQLSAELTRLVQAFEDPRALGDVRTLHGLKRYLHQRGLRLGFRLFDAGRATDRTVDLLLCEPDRVVHRVARIESIDFEPAAAATAGLPQDGGRLPYPVAVVVDGFTRQLLHGRRSFPGVRIFCYGNEVHYFLGYGSHPAFLRIDFSPPLLGGMIDLEFYGVSKTEMAQHPSPRLDALRAFFRRLEFDCVVESSRVRARYDKERAIDLGDIHARTEALFRLAPYLMDLDWTVGGLALDEEARARVAAAWADTFALWGALPLPLLLTRDRQGILAAIEEGAAGRAEIAWPGEGPYKDRFTPGPMVSAFAPLRRPLLALGLELPAGIEADTTPVGQLALERDLLRPLARSVARGEVVAGPEGLRPQPPELFAREAAAERFAALLAGSDADVLSASLAARLIGPLEKVLRFRTTGSVNGREVQHATLVLRNECLTFHVLRDAGGIIRLALGALDDVLWRRRDTPASAWVPSPCLDSAALAALLRADGYLIEGAGAPIAEAPAEVAAIRAAFLGAGPRRPRPPADGERHAFGLRASPGRAAGPALFGTTRRRPEDFDGAVLVAPSIRPEDGPFLYHCAGVVSTGGGILSHAGLIAAQFRKPALVVPGEWRAEPGAVPALVYRTTEYRQDESVVHGLDVSVRRDIRDREHRLREGDLLVVDADSGTLRVLGQERDALALHEGLRALADLGARLARQTDDAGLLALRGRRLRARFLVERILARLEDPVLATHAVEELLLGPPLAASPGMDTGNARLLALLLANRHVGPVARAALNDSAVELERRALASREAALLRIPTSSSVDEILALRQDVTRRHAALRDAATSLAAGGLGTSPDAADVIETIERAGRQRLETLREDATRLVRVAADRDADAGGDAVTIPAPAPVSPRLRHDLRRLERINRILGQPPDPLVTEARRRLARDDQRALASAIHRDVLVSAECGFEMYPLIGWKAANLAEVERLSGSSVAPAWFAITDHAFQRVLDLRVGGPAAGAGTPEDTAAGATLREAIDAVLRRHDLDNARRSAAIRALWERVRLPDNLVSAIIAAYRNLDPADPCFVAVRSSALEEDTERVARAGEFDTFLFVRGEDALVEHVRRAWAGLWTERAIHHRALLGPPAVKTGGGIIVQRMARARVAGILMTINAADGDFREMVINAGLGLGEGIVSGAVAADHVVVAKDRDLTTGPLRFRYATADKQEQVVFNERSGVGTARVECRYHQRLRPALEYVELRELARIGARLEEAFGHPLDVEFAIEGARLFVLQARPVAGPLTVLNESEERHP
jgi:pyruvate,water dikinase